MRVSFLAACALTAVTSVVAARPAGAQFYSYPSFDLPRVVLREYNFAVADGREAGTSLVFQWRERTSQFSHVQLDAGFADPNARNADARLILGGVYAYKLLDADTEFPLDMLFTAGFGGSFGDGTSFYRVPVGLNIGRRFALDGSKAITLFAHPRLAIDMCSNCGRNGRRDTKLGVDVDIGTGVEVSPSVSVRLALLLAGTDFYGRDNAVGLSLGWTPRALR